MGEGEGEGGQGARRVKLRNDAKKCVGERVKIRPTSRIPCRVLDPVKLVHPDHGPLGGLEHRGVDRRQRERGVPDEPGRPVPLDAAAGPGLAHREVDGCEGAEGATTGKARASGPTGAPESAAGGRQVGGGWARWGRR